MSPASYLTGSAITLTAAPDTNWIIGAWQGTDDDDAFSSQNIVTMPDSDHAAGVTYRRCHVLTISHSGNGANPAANPSNSPGCSPGRYLGGTVITLTAAPGNDWTVSGWMGTDDDEAVSWQNNLTMPRGRPRCQRGLRSVSRPGPISHRRRVRSGRRSGRI